MDSETALVLRESLPLALRPALSLWADATTDSGTSRRNDLLRDKQRAVASFFSFIKKTPGEVEPTDVKQWQQEMEGKPMARSTVYHRISLLSSFYLWAMRDPQLGQSIESNPAVLARPKAPRLSDRSDPCPFR